MKNLNRWARLFAGMIIMLFAGIIYAWSILKTPLLHEFQWNNAELGINFTITMCCFCLGGILSGKLLEKIAPRIIIRIGAFLTLLGFLLTSQMTGKIIVLYVSYGVCCGFGIGMVYNAVITVVSSWFPDKRATASGAMMMGFGLSSLILGSAANQIIVQRGWRFCYVAIGIAIFIVLVAGAQFIMTNPNKHNCKLSAEIDPSNYKPKQMLRQRSFWKFYIYSILIAAIGTCVISFAKDIAISFGMSKWFAVLSVGILSVCNGLARVLFGFIYDKFGSKKAFLIANLFAIISAALLLLTLYVSSVWIGVSAFIVVGLSYGAIPTLSSGFVASAYGPKHFSVNFSIANTFLFIASLSSSIGGAMQNSSGGYFSIFIMLICFAIAALILCLSMKNHDNAKNLIAKRIIVHP